MPLLAPAYFELLFEGLMGKSVGFLPLDGNVGDLMIRTATMELFDFFDIKFHQITESELASGVLKTSVDEIVISGGGNMGTLWPDPYKQRRKSLDFGLPVTIFPQSFTRNDEETDCYKCVFVREIVSKNYHEDYILAPDTALGLSVPGKLAEPVVETGLFLRNDIESCLGQNASALIDPINISSTIEEYLELASMFENIITDRLHFAIAGLIAGRHVTLLPNSYHKNRSMYQTWLEDLGCHWLDDVNSVSYDSLQVEQQLWKRLAGAPSNIVAWDHRPVMDLESRLEAVTDIEEYLACCDVYDQLDFVSRDLVSTLVDGKRTIEDMVMIIASRFPDHIASAGRDVQSALKIYANTPVTFS